MFKLSQISNFSPSPISLSSLAANMKGFTKYFQGQVKSSRNPQYVLERSLLQAAAVATVCVCTLQELLGFFHQMGWRGDTRQNEWRHQTLVVVQGDIISVRIIVIVLLALSSVQLIHHNYNLHSSATTTNINSSL